MLVGTSNQGLFRSLDGGAAWTQVPQHTSANVRDLWLAADGQTAVAATYGVGLLRTTDGGASWTGVAPEAGQLFLCLGASQNGDLFAGSYDRGVWKSRDNGASWVATSFPSTKGVIVLTSVGNRIYAGSVDNGLWRTADAGATWQQVGFAGKRVRAIAFDSGTNTLAVSVWDDGVYMSTDEGATWQRTNTGLDNTNVITLLVVDSAHVGRELWAGTEGKGVLRWNGTDVRWEALALPDWSVYTLWQWGDVVYAGSNGVLWAYTPQTEMRVMLSNDPGGDIAPNETITYTITYINGPSAAKDVRVYNTIPAGTELVPGSISHGGRSTGGDAGDTVVWIVGDLPANATNTVQYQVRRLSPSLNDAMWESNSPQPAIVNVGAHVTWVSAGRLNAAVSGPARNPRSQTWLPLLNRR
ncbi:MAG: hypothetical protein QXS54_02435 [Candidatus Methanomethylicaceae archaeon]